MKRLLDPREAASLTKIARDRRERELMPPPDLPSQFAPGLKKGPDDAVSGQQRSSAARSASDGLADEQPAAQQADHSAPDALVKSFMSEIDSMLEAPTAGAGDRQGHPSNASPPPSDATTPTPTATAVWQEVLDPKTKHIYYWNVQTGEVSWTRPPDMNGGKATVPNAHAPPSSVRVTSPVDAAVGGEASAGTAKTVDEKLQAFMREIELIGEACDQEDIDTAEPPTSTQESRMDAASVPAASAAAGAGQEAEKPLEDRGEDRQAGRSRGGGSAALEKEARAMLADVRERVGLLQVEGTAMLITKRRITTELGTRKTDWEAGELSSAYFLKKLHETADAIKELLYEQENAPKADGVTIQAAPKPPQSRRERARRGSAAAAAAASSEYRQDWGAYGGGYDAYDYGYYAAMADPAAYAYANVGMAAMPYAYAMVASTDMVPQSDSATSTAPSTRDATANAAESGPVVNSRRSPEAQEPPVAADRAEELVAAAALGGGEHASSSGGKKRKAAAPPIGLGHRKQLQLIGKWQRTADKAAEEEASEWAEQERAEVAKEADRIDRWKERQLASGAAKSNPNFMPLGERSKDGGQKGQDWRQRARSGRSKGGGNAG
ncbi:unnamed protein product [Vitrella brassicaformis CCMP3155]|uniref:WW domain-containing protein n=1 Tax=Vitrella brassicaformis (strain CCMP3155) TaxID=1169540 RepID=A0A0G4G0V5_VITBC|nr:unnamed protein product [Vitrella brassicaformis CCMP3155]|eukprot:CEM21170.1 unnamed protein product [Vitrella brassicaformis CCMP3155]